MPVQHTDSTLRAPPTSSTEGRQSPSSIVSEHTARSSLGEAPSPLQILSSADCSDTALLLAQRRADAEADAFHCLSALMCAPFLSGELRDIFIKASDDHGTGVKGVLLRFTAMMRRREPELFAHLEGKLGLSSYLYSFRWISTLLVREFPFPDVIILWDSLLSDPDRFSFLLHTCVAMLRLLKPQLLACDMPRAMKLLRGEYPPCEMRAIRSAALAVRAEEQAEGILTVHHHHQGHHSLGHSLNSSMNGSRASFSESARGRSFGGSFSGGGSSVPRAGAANSNSSNRGLSLSLGAGAFASFGFSSLGGGKDSGSHSPSPSSLLAGLWRANSSSSSGASAESAASSAASGSASASAKGSGGTTPRQQQQQQSPQVATPALSPSPTDADRPAGSQQLRRLPSLAKWFSSSNGRGQLASGDTS